MNESIIFRAEVDLDHLGCRCGAWLIVAPDGASYEVVQRHPCQPGFLAGAIAAGHLRAVSPWPRIARLLQRVGWSRALLRRGPPDPAVPAAG